jgi:DNA-binding MarR family transcriptional regulator
VVVENAAMPSKRALDSDLTPQGHLEEKALHGLLGYQLAQAAVPSTRAFVRVVGGPLDLRPVEFTILQLVKENSAVTPGRLSRALAMTAPGVTIWLDRLQLRELIKRERSPTDGRAQNVSITRKGRDLVGRALASLVAADQALLHSLSLGERAMLLELLHKVAKARTAA